MYIDNPLKKLLSSNKLWNWGVLQMEPKTKLPINEGLLPEVSEEEQVQQAIRRFSNECPDHFRGD